MRSTFEPRPTQTPCICLTAALFFLQHKLSWPSLRHSALPPSTGSGAPSSSSSGGPEGTIREAASGIRTQSPKSVAAASWPKSRTVVASTSHVSFLRYPICRLLRAPGLSCRSHANANQCHRQSQPRVQPPIEAIPSVLVAAAPCQASCRCHLSENAVAPVTQGTEGLKPHGCSIRGLGVRPAKIPDEPGSRQGLCLKTVLEGHAINVCSGLFTTPPRASLRGFLSLLPTGRAYPFMACSSRNAWPLPFVSSSPRGSHRA